MFVYLTCTCMCYCVLSCGVCVAAGALEAEGGRSCELEHSLTGLRGATT